MTEEKSQMVLDANHYCQKNEQQFMVDTIVRHDRSNNGLTIGDVKERMMDIKPGLSTRQAGNILHKTLKVNHSDQLKKHVVIHLAMPNPIQYLLISMIG